MSPQTTTLPPVLVVEDSNEDFTALTRAFRRCGMPNPILRCQDGDDAIDYLLGHAPHRLGVRQQPAFVLLDLNMPGTDGKGVLRVVKHDERSKGLPVIVFSSSGNPYDIDDCYDLGVNSYIVKPIDYPLFESRVADLKQYWLGTVSLPGHSL